MFEFWLKAKKGTMSFTVELSSYLETPAVASA